MMTREDIENVAEKMLEDHPELGWSRERVAEMADYLEFLMNMTVGDFNGHNAAQNHILQVARARGAKEDTPISSVISDEERKAINEQFSALKDMVSGRPQ